MSNFLISSTTFRRYIQPVLWLVMTLAISFQTQSQTIRYVKQNGIGNGSSWAEASGNLQEMIDVSASGGQVWVAAGTYQPFAGQSFSMKEGVKIYGGFYGNETELFRRNVSTDLHRSILLGNEDRVITNTDLSAASVIDGFTIKGGRQEDGAGMLNSYASPTIANCIFFDNWATRKGGAISNWNSSPAIYSSVFASNNAYRGGAIHCEDNSSPKYYNCLIINNTAPWGAAVYIYPTNSSPEFINCTLFNNIGIYGGIYLSQRQKPTFKNTIIHSTDTYLDLTTNDPTVRLNCLLDGEPMFVNSADPDGADNIFGTSDDGFQITTSSPARNGGNNTYFPSVGNETDLAGNPRITEQHVDIGAYEYVVAAHIHTRYVRQGGTGNGYTWKTASGDLQEMINQSVAGNEVWVAAGEYQPASGQSFSMKEGVKIYGGFAQTGNPTFNNRNYANNVTTLRGNGAGVIANVNNGLTQAALLDGFTITGGNAGHDNDGGGIRNWYAAPALYNLKIKGNSARSGGGIDNGHANILLVNSEISGNTAHNVGSGVSNYASHSPTYVNVTISGNTGSAQSAAVFNESARPVFVNAIVYGNTDNAGILDYDGVSSNVTYSLIQGLPADAALHNLDGTKSYPNLFVDPSAGNYLLTVGSEANDKGNNTAFPTDLNISLDLSGDPRLAGSTIDLGAYENQLKIQTRYVRQGGNGNGYAWATASGDLQAMINESHSGNEVWVAAGEYQPASGESLSMKEGVKIYGGFAATGTPEFTDRNWNQHVTTLKGNGSHVIRNDQNGLTNAALLDGFTITEGSSVNGAGMLNNLTYPLINHCIFKGNTASQWGAGIYNIGPGTTTVVNSLFYQNTAQSGAAAFNQQNARPRFINVTIVNNLASENGGALHNYEGAETELVNAIVWGNRQMAGSSQLYTAGTGSVKAYFSVLEGGAEAIIGDQTLVEVLSEDPLFIDAANGNFTLQGCSPALNIGTAGLLTGFYTDLAGNNRRFGIVDAGAYEYQATVPIAADRLSVDGDVATVSIAGAQTYAIRVDGDLCRSVAEITPNGDQPISGNVTVTTLVDNAVQTHNGTPYVQRHYDILPEGNASAATARVLLFFTQQEFNAYNDKLGAEALPTGVADNTGRSNIRVYQYHGRGSNGNSPGSYQGGLTTHTPDVKWNYALERWEISFDVTGFSGFFVGSADAALPVKLVSFEARNIENNTVALQWRVTEQVDMAEYAVERSIDGHDFTVVGSVDANEENESQYRFTDVNSYEESVMYYRLKMTELDGRFSYSKIISVTLSKSDLVVYPMPAREFARVKGKGISGMSLTLINTQGVVLKKMVAVEEVHEIDLSSLPTGIYYLKTGSGQLRKIVKE